jgi:hypothetical protein
VNHRNLVVILERAGIARPASVAIGREHLTDAAHPERRQLGRPQRAHTGGPEHMDALR